MENKIELDNKYDKELAEVPFYKDQPGYMPFIGKNYDEKRLFLIAESHKTQQENCDISVEEWYSGKVKWRHFTTESITELGTKSVCYEPAKILRDLDIGNTQHPCNYIAFMNAFQRPLFHPTDNIGMGKDKRYLKDPKPDNDKAFEVITEVIKIIKPKFVMFLSTRAWWSVGRHLEFEPKDYTSHPKCSHWNTPASIYGNRTGSKKFVDCVQEHCK